MGHCLSSRNKESYFKIVTGNSFKWKITNFRRLLKDDVTIISPSYVMQLYNHSFRVNLSLNRRADPMKNTLKLSFALTHESIPTTEVQFDFSLIKKEDEHVQIQHLIANTQEVFTTTIEDFIDVDFITSNNMFRIDVLEVLCEIHIEANDIEVQKYYKYFENPKFSDVTIFHRSGQSIYAHKLLLLDNPIFAKLFKHKIRQHEVIKIYNVEFNYLKEMIRFIYTGELENLKSCTPSLYVAAEKYEIPKLKKLCEYHLLQNLNSDSAIEILVEADENGSTDLKSKILDYISENLKDITDGESLRSIENKNLLVDIIAAVAATKKT